MNANPRESYPPEWKNTFQHIDPILNHIFPGVFTLTFGKWEYKLWGLEPAGWEATKRSRQRDAVSKYSPFLQVKPQGFTVEIPEVSAEIPTFDGVCTSQKKSQAQ